MYSIVAGLCACRIDKKSILKDFAFLCGHPIDELYRAGLGLKKITIPDMNTLTNSRFRKLIIENFPPLAQGGGFDFLRCARNTKHLELFSELAQSNPKILQERSYKGKVFVRPVQQDLLLSAIKKPRVSSLGIYICPK